MGVFCEREGESMVCGTVGASWNSKVARFLLESRAVRKREGKAGVQTGEVFAADTSNY